MTSRKKTDGGLCEEKQFERKHGHVHISSFHSTSSLTLILRTYQRYVLYLSKESMLLYQKNLSIQRARSQFIEVLSEKNNRNMVCSILFQLVFYCVKLPFESRSPLDKSTKFRLIYFYYLLHINTQIIYFLVRITKFALKITRKSKFIEYLILDGSYIGAD